MRQKDDCPSNMNMFFIMCNEFTWHWQHAINLVLINVSSLLWATISCPLQILISYSANFEMLNMIVHCKEITFFLQLLIIISIRLRSKQYKFIWHKIQHARGGVISRTKNYALNLASEHIAANSQCHYLPVDNKHWANMTPAIWKGLKDAPDKSMCYL